MVRTLRLEEMTMSQLKKRAKDLEIQLNNTAKATNPKEYKELETQLEAVRQRMGDLKGGSQSTFSVLKGGLAVLAGNLMTKAVDKPKELVSEGVEFVKIGIDMAKNAEGQIRAFKNFSDSTRLMQNLKKATSGTVSELKLMNNTLRAKELGVPVEELATLMDFARRQAQKLGKDVDYMTNSIVDGLGRKSTLVLDNLGLSATRVQAEVKKSGDLTQGVIKIVNEELQKQGDYVLTAADKASQAAAKWEDAQLKVGQRFMWLGELWDNLKSTIADQIVKLVGETRSLTEQFDDQLTTVAKLEIEINPLIEDYNALKGKTNLSTKEQKELNKIMKTISNTIPGVTTEIDKYGNALSINVEKVKEFIEAEKVRLQWLNKAEIESLQKQKEKITKEIETQNRISEEGKKIYRGGFASSSVEFDKSDKTLLEARAAAEELGKDLEGLEL
ncbi:MAG: hypothetical protein LUH22_06910 [Bacteroides sp.]|nr:hypothetical protein [Bacteroides sp.]